MASATVNTAQQVGGSLGTALLNTIATTATASFVAGKAASPAITAEAAVHGYITAFWWAAAIFAAGAVICGLLLQPGAPRLDPPPARPRVSRDPTWKPKENVMTSPCRGSARPRSLTRSRGYA